MKKGLSLTTKIFIGLGLGLVTGILLYFINGTATDTFIYKYLIDGLFRLVG